MTIFAIDKMDWWGRLLTSDIFQTRLLSYVLVFNLISDCSKPQNMKRYISSEGGATGGGAFFTLIARSPL